MTFLEFAQALSEGKTIQHECGDRFKMIDGNINITPNDMFSNCCLMMLRLYEFSLNCEIVESEIEEK